MCNFEEKKKEYASLIVSSGACVSEGDYVIIYCETSAGDFAELVVEECYRKGADWVEIQWKNANLDRMNAEYAKEEYLCTVPQWRLKRLETEAQILPVTIRLISSEFIVYNEISRMNQQKANKAYSLATKKYQDMINNKHKWTAAGVATPNWAAKLYPEDKDAIKKLWNDIFVCCGVNGDGTAIEKWEKKISGIEEHRDLVNSMNLKSLHFTTGLGTDLYAQLPECSRFAGGCNRQLGYSPNIPTEEIFTSPDKYSVHGKLVASIPLCLNNQLIEGLTLTVEDGRVTDVHADTGEEYFREYIATDEGAAMFGELAIVDASSSIRKLGHLMLSTLFDENATCHAAVGRGFATTLSDGMDLTKEELNARGINDSSVHCDIMFGTYDTKITGQTESGEIIVLMENGRWKI